VENLRLVFHFSIRLRGRSCGNVGISQAFGEISKGLVGRVGSLLLAFHAFHSPGISTAPLRKSPWSPVVPRRGYGSRSFFLLLFFNR
jgi:hypothetical protein